MGKINSKSKGKNGERDWRDFLIKHGFTCRRGQQFSGGGDSPDVVCTEMHDMFHPEVKRTEKLQLYKAIEQAKNDCPKGKWRYVAHRQSRKEWLVIMPAEDWMDLVKEYLERSK